MHHKENFRDEAVRKIGQNILIFQKMESALKMLIASSNFEGTASDTSSALERRPLGHPVNDFTKNIPGAKEDIAPPDDLPEMWASLSFKIDCDFEQAKEYKRELLELVAERNSLIHARLASFNPESEEECRDFIIELDAQNDRLINNLDVLKFLITSNTKAQNLLKDTLESDEFKNIFKLSNRNKT